MVIVRITLAAHADLNTNILQIVHIFHCRILNALVGMMNKILKIICLSCLKSLGQSSQCELRIDVATEIPTNATSAETSNTTARNTNSFDNWIYVISATHS